MDLIQQEYGGDKEWGQEAEDGESGTDSDQQDPYKNILEMNPTTERESSKQINECQANGADTIDCEADTIDFEAWEGNPGDDRKSKVCFYTQTLVIVIIVTACIINMSLGNGDQTAWTGLLSTSLGILLPQPGVNWSKAQTRNKKKKKDKQKNKDVT